MTARELCVLGAILRAAVCKGVFGIYAARTAAYADGRLACGKRYAQNLGNDRLLRRLRHMTVGKGRLAFGEFFRKSGTAGTAAAAAIRACEVLKVIIYLFVCVGLAKLCNEKNTDGEDDRDCG